MIQAYYQAMMVAETIKYGGGVMKNRKNNAFYTGLAWLMLCALCSGCAKKKAAENVNAGDSGGLAVRYAEHFNIEYMQDGVKLVTDHYGRLCLLVPDGVEAPDVQADLLVRTPVKKAFFMSTTQAGLLDALDDESLYDSVAAVTIPAEQWVINPVAEGLRSGRIRYIAQNNWGAMDIEAVIRLSPDITFAGVLNPGSDDFEQFDEAGLGYAVLGEWLEDSNYGSLEWIKFIAAFYNKDREADAVFREKVARLDELVKLTTDIPADKRPVVASGSVYGGVVYTQGGDSITAREYRKAGGRYFLEEGTGGGALRITPEEFFDKARDADILIYNSMIQYTPDKAALLAESPLFSLFKSFKNDQIYVLSFGYYMNSAKMDVKFEDTVSIFHPELPGLNGLKNLSFYEKLPD
ncbi:MAG: ABC transporter substrate-binding protein [Spirochaetaceae bacterium]|nr:ABC transporter substrate-binding protein [Spirochaetaceae bacterium]